jgi:hypothetical protein
MPAGYYNSNRSPYCDKKSYTDTHNWCNKTPYKDTNGSAQGEVVFVYIDCKTHTVLKTGQKEPYEYPGVSTGPTRK